MDPRGYVPPCPVSSCSLQLYIYVQILLDTPGYPGYGVKSFPEE